MCVSDIWSDVLVDAGAPWSRAASSCTIPARRTGCMGSVEPVKVEAPTAHGRAAPGHAVSHLVRTSVVERKLLVRLRTDAGTGWGVRRTGRAALHERVRRRRPPRPRPPPAAETGGGGRGDADDVATVLAAGAGPPDGQGRWRWRCSSWAAPRPIVGFAARLDPDRRARRGGRRRDRVRRRAARRCRELRRRGLPAVKLKVQPGWDVEPVAAVRGRFGPDLALQVDANGVALRRRPQARWRPWTCSPCSSSSSPSPRTTWPVTPLAASVATPICLDESVTSVATAVLALDLGACSVINVKPGRMGGYLEAGRLHDLALARGVPLWCGGMLETGLGGRPTWPSPRSRASRCRATCRATSLLRAI